MRGVVSGGMVSALEFLGLRNVFDAVYGSSSGAMAGAYFVAGQARFGTTIYYQCINNRRFIRKANLALMRPVMDTGFLLDGVCRSIRPLRTSEIVDTDLPLHVVASSVISRKPVVLSGFADGDEVIEALRCSINVPGVAGPPVEFRDDRLLDAAIYESIPLRSAIQGGATNALVLQTRIAGGTRRAPPALLAAMFKMRLRSLPDQVVQDWMNSHLTYQRELNDLQDAEDGHFHGVDVMRIQLDDTHREVSQLETRRRVLEDAALAGFKEVIEAFGLTGFIPAHLPGGSFRTGTGPTMAAEHFTGF